MDVFFKVSETPQTNKPAKKTPTKNSNNNQQNKQTRRNKTGKSVKSRHKLTQKYTEKLSCPELCVSE